MRLGSDVTRLVKFASALAGCHGRNAPRSPPPPQTARYRRETRRARSTHSWQNGLPVDTSTRTGLGYVRRGRSTRVSDASEPALPVITVTAPSSPVLALVWTALEARERGLSSVDPFGWRKRRQDGGAVPLCRWAGGASRRLFVRWALTTLPPLRIGLLAGHRAFRLTWFVVIAGS